MAALKSNLFKSNSTLSPQQGFEATKPIAGVVSKIFSRNCDHFVHIQIKTKDGFFVVKGLTRVNMAVGARVIAMNCRKCKDKFGEFFSTTHFIESAPGQKDKFEEYLQKQFPDLERKKIIDIIEFFGERTIDIIDYSPDDLNQVPNLDVESLKYIKSFRNFGSLMDRVEDLCRAAKFPSNTSLEIINKFGVDAPDVMINNPYLLTQIKSIDINLVADFAKGKILGVNAKDHITFEIEKQVSDQLKNGNTIISKSDLIENVSRALELSCTSIETAIHNLLNKTPSPIKLRNIGSLDYISLSKVANIEKSIADNLLRISNGSISAHDLAKKSILASAQLNDSNQAAAIEAAFLNGVSIITGSAGTGKSTITEIITRLAKECGLQVKTCALSNSATRRIEQVTGNPSSTIHSLLVVNFEETTNDFSNFVHNSTNPMSGDVFIVDEFTMNDIYLCKSLFESIPTGSRLILLGDVGQIPSVGPGNVMRDIIDSELFPVSFLTKRHRTNKESKINLIADQIRNGNPKELNLDSSENFNFTQAKSPSLILHYILESYSTLSKDFQTVQILASRYGTEVGIDIINKKIRDFANPFGDNKNEIQVAEKIWREGDRVISLSNIKEHIQVCGEIGVIESIIPEREINGEKLDPILKLKFGNLKLDFDAKNINNNIDLAYALSVHKSQGREFESVIFVAPQQHASMLNQNILLTGETRARQFAHVIGDEKTIRQSIGISGNNRKTGLKNEILIVFKQSQRQDNKLQSKRPGIR